MNSWEKLSNELSKPEYSKVTAVILVEGVGYTLKINGKWQKDDKLQLLLGIEPEIFMDSECVKYTDNNFFHTDKEGTKMYSGKLYTVETTKSKETKVLIIKCHRIRNGFIEDMSSDLIRSISEMSEGFVLIGGEIDSGKSYFAYTVAEELNKYYDKTVFKIDRKMEFKHNVSHIIAQNEDKFKESLEIVSEVKPDVVIIDQIESYTELKQVMEVASRGILVIGTMYGNSCSNILKTMFKKANYDDYFEHLISQTLRCIITRRVILRNNVIPYYETLNITNSVRHILRTKDLDKLEGIMKTGYSMGVQDFEGSLINLRDSGTLSDNEFGQEIKKLNS